MNEQQTLSSEQVDAIGEILNISMGSAATAVSTMLDRQVVITIPKVMIEEFEQVDYALLEPAIIVNIEYVRGLTGSNVMVFRQSDMQMLLNLLMGSEEAPSEDFVFDEMSMSAACEVMNQMMGASATALSEFLGKSINISTPTASVLSSDEEFRHAVNVAQEDPVVSVSFRMTIEGVLDSQFISIMSISLAQMIVSQAMDNNAQVPEERPAEQVQPANEAQPTVTPPTPLPAQAPPHAAPAPSAAVPPAMQAQPEHQPGMPGQPPMPPYPYPGYMPPYYPPYEGYGMQQPQTHPYHPSMQVHTAQFPNFSEQPQQTAGPALAKSNMELVMNVPLSVSVEIGKTRKKIKDIMDFNKGTIIELEKQAGAPVDVVVNGQLIARGDVVVIEDNFGVRITEIVVSKDLIQSLGNP